MKKFIEIWEGTVLATDCIRSVDMHVAKVTDEEYEEFWSNRDCSRKQPLSKLSIFLTDGNGYSSIGVEENIKQSYLRIVHKLEVTCDNNNDKLTEVLNNLN